MHINIVSRAIEYSYHRRTDSRSVGLSFHWRTGSMRRIVKRVICSSRETENQSLTRMIPERTSISSKSEE